MDTNISKWSFYAMLACFIVFTGNFAIAGEGDYHYGYTTPHDITMPVPGEIGPDVLLDIPGMLTSPPDNPEVGDSWIWWLWLHDPMPPHFEQSVCTVRGKSDRAYVVVRDEEWLVSIDQADVDSILEYWENKSIGPYPEQGIYEIDSIAFGAPPDELDEDPRIYLMWMDFVISADGFFFWFDEFPDGTYPEYHSNECEVLYLNTMSSGGPSGDYMLAVIAHEFQHMIHWKYDDDELSWVNEGLSELAMWLFGNPDNISAFNSNPDQSLIVWDGTWADYIKTYLWSLYFYEQYGGHPAIYALVNEQQNSIDGYEQVLDDFGYSDDFVDVFANWAVANFLDDPTLSDGEFGYEGDDLPSFGVAGTYSSYPTSDIYKTVNRWGTDYYRFKDFDDFETLYLSFDGSDNNVYAVWGLALYETGTTEVFRMTLDEGTQTGSLEIPDLTGNDDEVILVVAGTSSSGSPGYYFTASANQGIESSASADMLPEIHTTPNPFFSNVNIQLTGSGFTVSEPPEVCIYDASGRLVNRLDATVTGNGNAMLIWDGTAFDGSRSSAGIYFAKVTANGHDAVVKMLRI